MASGVRTIARLVGGMIWVLQMSGDIEGEEASLGGVIARNELQYIPILDRKGQSSNSSSSSPLGQADCSPSRTRSIT